MRAVVFLLIFTLIMGATFLGKEVSKFNVGDKVFTDVQEFEIAENMDTETYKVVKQHLLVFVKKYPETPTAIMYNQKHDMRDVPAVTFAGDYNNTRKVHEQYDPKATYGFRHYYLWKYKKVKGEFVRDTVRIDKKFIKISCNCN